MARGWESKSIEAQIESVNERRAIHRVKLMNTALIETERKKDGLLLQRTRVLRDMETCSSDRYRKTLSDGLSYLEVQLTALGWQR